MTDLVPLLESSSDETELALLRSLAREEPSSRAVARTAAALGLGTGTLAVASSATAASAVSSATAASAVSGIAKGWDLGLGAESARNRREQRPGRQRRSECRVLGAEVKPLPCR